MGQQTQNLRSLTVRVLFLGLSLFLSSPLQATFMTSSRIGGGASRLRGAGADFSVFSQQGTLRFALFDPKSTVIVGLDATAYRFESSARAGLQQPINGNNLDLFVGTYREPWSIWVASGAGQIRILDRVDDRVDDPHRFVTAEQQIGASTDLYRATYGKIEGCIVWRTLQPEQAWRRLYKLSRIEAWQIELGFKFLDW